MVVCLELGADLQMAQLMPLPLTVNKIQIGCTFLEPAHPGIPGKRAIKRVCVCGCVCVWVCGCVSSLLGIKRSTSCDMQTGGVGNSSCSVSAAVSDESRVGRPGHASRPQRADLLPVSSGLLRRDDWLRQPGRTSALLT